MWPHENGTICATMSFVQFEVNPCDQASCGLVHSKTLRFHGKMSILTRKYYITGERSQKDKWFYFHACT